jgi:hypothetical protein
VREVAPVRTPLSGSGAASALAGARQRALGGSPSAPTLSLLVAQWAHETGRGSAMFNHNFAGLKGTSPDGMSAVYATHEGSGEGQTRVHAHFRAYESPATGADDYVNLLVQRYPDAVSAAQRGDATGFVQALKTKGYFSGDAGAYLKSVSSLQQQALLQGFDAVGAAPDGGSARALPALSAQSATAFAAPFDLGPASAASALYARGSFADEVGRVALLSSALRIGRAPDSEG